MNIKDTMSQYMEETIIQTPQPKACSTESKNLDINQPLQSMKPRPLQFDESLDTTPLTHNIDALRKDIGLMSLNNAEICNNKSLNKMGAPLSEDLRKNREKVRAVLEKSSKLSLSSFDGTPAPSESTVDENDLIGGSINKTPSLLTYQHSRNSMDFKGIPKLSLTLENFSRNIRNPDKSLQECFAEYDSDCFVPAEDARAQLMADEMSWRRKYDMPNKDQSNFEDLSSTGGEDKVSMGEFFGRKSNECSSVFGTTSPERELPEPLLSSTTLYDENGGDVSAVSMSLIQQYIASDYTDSPNTFFKKICNKAKNKSTTNRSFKNMPLQSNKEVSITNESNNKSRTKLFTGRQSSSFTDLNSETDSRHSQSSTVAKNAHISKGNKENVCNKSASTIRSAVSMEALTDTKMISSNKQELVWGCVRVGKGCQQRVAIKSKYLDKIKLQVASSSPNFKIANTDTDAYTTLRKGETHHININFNPIQIGPHVGKLMFTPVVHGEPQKSHRQSLKMFGYGGYTHLKLSIPKGSHGERCLNLGMFRSSQTITKFFSVINEGNIPAFAFLTSQSVKLVPIGDIHIEPSKIVIQPNDSVEIRVSFTPAKGNIGEHANSSNMIDISRVNIVTGAESTRGRIRQLINMANKRHLHTDKLMEQLSEKFEGESLQSEMHYFSESIEAIKVLNQQLENIEISMAMEYDPDRTLIQDCFDDSSIFHTITNQSNMTVLDIAKFNLFRVDPSEIVFVPNTKHTDNIFLISSSKQDATFKVTVHPDILKVSNSTGVIHPGDVKLLKLSVKSSNVVMSQLAKVTIRCDNEILNVLVKFLKPTE